MLNLLLLVAAFMDDEGSAKLSGLLIGFGLLANNEYINQLMSFQPEKISKKVAAVRFVGTICERNQSKVEQWNGVSDQNAN